MVEEKSKIITKKNGTWGKERYRKRQGKGEVGYLP